LQSAIWKPGGTGFSSQRVSKLVPVSSELDGSVPLNRAPMIEIQRAINARVSGFDLFYLLNCSGNFLEIGRDILLTANREHENSLVSLYV